MTDIPRFVNEGPIDAGDDPVQFTLAYKRRTPDGLTDEEDTFSCLPRSQVPYVWILDYFAAGIGDQVGQSAGTLEFFDRVLLEDDDHTDRKRFDALLHDRQVVIRGRTLQQIQVYLITEYERPDPTRARSAGPKRSRSGPPAKSTGSKARAGGKASTS